MYDQPGIRVPVVFPGLGEEEDESVAHGSPAVIDGKAGFLDKTTQLDRFTRPTDEEATHIMPGEGCEMFIGGAHKLELAGELAGLKVGTPLWIDPDTFEVTNEPAKGDVPLGVIDSIDTAPATDVALVNCNALNIFMAHA